MNGHKSDKHSKGGGGREEGGQRRFKLHERE